MKIRANKETKSAGKPFDTDRRRVITSGCAFASLAATAGCLSKTGQRSSAPPNVVFILADDLGAHDLSCYGRPDFETPNIDNIAHDGIRLTRSYANSPTCSPTRVALLSGKYQNRMKVGNYDPLPDGANLGFPPDVDSLASIFRDRGYRTGLIGKWHLGLLPDFGPLKSGYDYFYGIRGSHVDYFEHEIKSFFSSSQRADLYENETLVKNKGYLTDLLTDRAVSFVRRHAQQPFFMSLHYTAPHWPWQSPNNPNTERLSDAHFDGGNVEIFAEMIETLDRGVGQVLAALDQIGRRENTIVVFTSDNGGERYSMNWPLRGAKYDLWEGGIRVPAIVRWPGRIQSGIESNQTSISMDWMPTLSSMTGAPLTPEQTDGIDISPMLYGKSSIDRTLFWRTQWGRAVRKGRWKYLSQSGRDYLYDLDFDEMERANRKIAEPSIFTQFIREFETWNESMLPIPTEGRIPLEIIRRLDTLEPPDMMEENH